ncbi:hypothetical protein HanIR_Chr12g0607141 [Helianthus annuus]|nr:hypothetical protein HanIR_Chr12g0607141 [Helianthus annuus]
MFTFEPNPIYIYIYIYKGVHPPPPRSIPFKPRLRDGDVAAHPHGNEALHTLQPNNIIDNVRVGLSHHIDDDSSTNCPGWVVTLIDDDYIYDDYFGRLLFYLSIVPYIVF